MPARQMRGFTLIELIIVVVIVSILAVIAIPSYQSSIRKSRRAEAQAALLHMQLQQEKWRANNTSYSSSATAVGAPTSSAGIAAYYTFSVVGAGATTFNVRATAISGKGQEQDRQNGTACSPLNIDQSGARTPTACW